MFPRDGRGRHDNRPKKIKMEQMAMVKEHIFSIIRSDRVNEILTFPEYYSALLNNAPLKIVCPPPQSDSLNA